MRLTIYGDKVSGNCRKVLWVIERLGLDYAWIDVDVVAGDARRPEFLALHPGGQTPAVLLEDGRPLAQSNAIMLHLAEGTDLIPMIPMHAPKCSSGCSGSSIRTSR